MVEGEKILWAGQNNSWQLTPISFTCGVWFFGVCLWAALGGLISLIIGIFSSDLKLGITGLALASAFIGLAALVCWQWYVASSRLYVVTDQRAMVISYHKVEVNRYYEQIALTNIEEIQRMPDSNAPRSLIFTGTRNKLGYGRRVSFSNFNEVQKVEGLVIQARIRSTIKEYLSKESSWPSASISEWPRPF